MWSLESYFQFLKGFGLDADLGRERTIKMVKEARDTVFPSLFNKIKFLLKNEASQSPLPPPPPKKILGFYGASLIRVALILVCSFGMCHPQEPPSIPAIYKKPGGTQLSFWYRFVTRRAANGGFKNGYAPKIGAKA